MIEVTYIFLSYGKLATIHKQTLAAICSLVFAKRDSEAPYCIRLYTEMPEYYAWLGEQVDVQTLSPHQIKEWMGLSSFSLRVKPCLLIEAARSCPGAMIFLDSDMVIMKSLDGMEAAIQEGSSFLQCKEYLVSSRTTKERREFMCCLKGIDLGRGVALNEDSWMWNSGVIGLCPQDFQYLDSVLSAIDQMTGMGLSPRTRLKEQLAFSLYFSATERLKGLDDEVLHYWGNKPEWDGFLDNWLLSVVGQKLDVVEAGRLLLSMQPFPAAVAPKRSKSEKRKAKIRKLLRLD